MFPDPGRSIAAHFLGLCCMVSLVVPGSFSPVLAMDHRVGGVHVTNYGLAYTRIGKAALAKGAYLRAVRVLTAAIERGGPPDAFKFRGRAYWYLNRPEETVTDLTRFLKLKPSDARGWLWRGDAHNLNFEYSRAAIDYTEALRLDPSSAEAHIGRGIAYAALEMYVRAARDFLWVLRSDPRNVDALINVGVTCMMAGSDEEGLRHLEQALSDDIGSEWEGRVKSLVRVLQDRVQERETAEGKRRGDFGHYAKTALRPSILEMAREMGEETVPAVTRSNIPEKPSVRATLGKIGGYSHLRARAGRSPGAHGSALEKYSKVLPENMTKTWTGSYLGATIDLRVKRRIKTISGLLRIRFPFGKEDSYHFQGTLNNGRISARHASGHLFQGKIGSDGRLVGTVRTRDGRSFNVDLYAK